MIDLRVARENPTIVRESQIARGEDPTLIDAALAADDARRTALGVFEAKRAEQNALSKSIGKAPKEERATLAAAGKALAAQVKELQVLADKAQEDAVAAAMRIGNIIESDVPSGGEDDYEVLETVGNIRDFAAEGFSPLDHLDLGLGLDAIDTERGAKVSGSRFYYLKGIGARLELALINAAVDLALEHGFTPMITPCMVSPQTMSGTGFLGAHSDEIYYLPADDLYLTGTSEVALAGYHTGEILDLNTSPVRYAGLSACFRREAGSYGKDTRGIIRVHQFNKVEMFSYCRPQEARDEHRRLLALEREMLAKVELPYRIINTAAGDLGSSAAQKFDCEAFLPSQNRFMEVTSTSNCTTFQARRLSIRYRDEEGNNQIAATLNGTLATTRWLVAILENHQLPGGAVKVPTGLRPYLGGLEVLEPVVKN